MRRLLRPLALFAVFSLGTRAARAQATGAAKKHEPQHEMSPWKEMNVFHGVLAAVYHPASEANNVKPLRQKADELAAKAREWSASKPPAECATDSIRTTVGTISIDAVALANLVLAESSDAALKKGISALHDKFEGIEKSCRGSGMKHLE